MNYEEIRNYWEGRAAGDISAQSTTQDVFLRQIELNTLTEKIGKYSPKLVADMGSGDGRTTIGLAQRFSDVQFFGFDYSLSMVSNSRKLVSAQTALNIAFGQHDIRDELSESYDLIYTTRCLINLPSWELQKEALRNIHNALSPSGVYLMIENFIEGQDNFNDIRRNFGLSEIPVREHNLFFNRQSLLDYSNALFDMDEEINISSMYYLVSRVIYSKICSDAGSKPDYFDAHHRYAAGLPFCGEFGPVRLICFRKK